MELKTIVTLLYENEEDQLICLQDEMENVLYIGTVGDLRRDHPKSLSATINTMFTERYGAYNGKSGLTVVINR
jgi:hypothetical protein